MQIPSYVHSYYAAQWWIFKQYLWILIPAALIFTIYSGAQWWQENMSSSRNDEEPSPITSLNLNEDK